MDNSTKFCFIMTGIVVLFLIACVLNVAVKQHTLEQELSDTRDLVVKLK